MKPLVTHHLLHLRRRGWSPRSHRPGLRLPRYATNPPSFRHTTAGDSLPSPPPSEEAPRLSTRTEKEDADEATKDGDLEIVEGHLDLGAMRGSGSAAGGGEGQKFGSGGSGGAKDDGVLSHRSISA